MAQQRIQANRYELKGHHTEITYEEAAFDGQPHLTYRVFQGPATRTFSGDQIRSQASEIGKQITVTTEAVPDKEETTLTLLLPMVNLVGATEQTFETLVIITTQRSSIAGPGLVNGAVQRYHVVKLEGKAQFVLS
jgi:hypothetical protein